MKQAVEKFELPIEILPEHIDQLGHVNNIVYLRWVQDAAIAHWSAAAPKNEQEKLLWVVTRHEINYKRPALPGDKIIARTWVGTASSRAFDRHTEIIRATDRKILAVAKTAWCPIDRQTGKPTKVSDEIRDKFSVPG